MRRCEVEEGETSKLGHMRLLSLALFGKLHYRIEYGRNWNCQTAGIYKENKGEYIHRCNTDATSIRLKVRSKTISVEKISGKLLRQTTHTVPCRETQLSRLLWRIY